MDSGEVSPKQSNGIETQDQQILQDLNSTALQQQRQDAQSQGNFLQADRIYQRIQELQDKIKNDHQKALEQKQQNQLQELQENFKQEFQSFNQSWDRKMEQYKETCRNSEAELMEKHSEDFEKMHKNLQESIPVIPKHSSEYLNLKRIQDTLVRKKQYKEAHQIQQKMKRLEDEEKGNWGSGRQSKIELSLNGLTKRQENELNSFKQKSLNGLEELKKKRAAEMETFVKKFQNIRQGLEISHKLEQNKFEGRHTTGSGLYKTDAGLANKLIISPRSSLKA